MSTFPFLLSVADELDNLDSQTYMDDFGLGFHPHRKYYKNPSIQLSLPASTEWFDGGEEKKRDYHFEEPPDTVEPTIPEVEDDYVENPEINGDARNLEKVSSPKLSLEFLSCFSTKRKNLFGKTNK